MSDPQLPAEGRRFLPQNRPIGPRELVEAFLSGRSKNTLDAYQRDLQFFASFLGVEGVERAVETLLSCSPGQANAAVLGHRAAMLERGLSSATINRRLAAIRAVSKLARVLGLATWVVEIENVPHEPRRELRGPSVEGVTRMLDAIDRHGGKWVARDRLILRLLFDWGLRRSEVRTLDLDHVDAERGVLRVLAKGRRERQTLILPEPTREALREWLTVRGSLPGPLVFSRPGRRLNPKSLWRIVERAAEKAGIGAIAPHGLRRRSITSALDLLGGDVRSVSRFSRHRSVGTVMMYDLARNDAGAEIAARVAALVPGRPRPGQEPTTMS